MEYLILTGLIIAVGVPTISLIALFIEDIERDQREIEMTKKLRQETNPF